MKRGIESTKESKHDLLKKSVGLGPEEKAMNNTLVLQKLATFLDVSELKTARHVNSLWNYSMCPELQRRSWSTILDNDSYYGITKYLACGAKYPNAIEINNYIMKYMNLTDTNNVKTRTIEFFEKFGHKIHRLHLKRCTIDWNGDFWYNLIRISKWTPNLYDIFFHECCFLRTNAIMKCPQSIVSQNRITALKLFSDRTDSSMPCDPTFLFDQFPNLTTLHLLDLNDEENIRLLESTKPPRGGKSKEPKHNLKISDLDIFGEKEYSVREIPSNQFRLFLNMKIPLAKLTIDVGENITPADFGLMLSNFSNTLVELTVWRGLLANKMDKPGFPFGVLMPVLEEVAIPESCVIDMTFIYLLPAVRRLTIRQCDLNPLPFDSNIFSTKYSFNQWKKFSTEPHQNLSEIQVEFVLTEEDIEFFKGIAPHLRVAIGFFDREFKQRVF